MEGFYAFCIWTIVTCGLAIGAGRFMPLGDVAQDINNKGEVVIRNTVYQCKPVAVQVEGRRVEIK